MNLADVISGAVYKRLVAVDLPKRVSNQHEINGVYALRKFFGTNEKTREPILWHYFADGAEPLSGSSEVTFYNARENQPHRVAEWRLYYVGEFLHSALVGDVLVLLRFKKDDSTHGLILQQGSSWLRATEKLFGVSSLNPENFEFVSSEELGHTPLGPLQLEVLDELGISEVVPPEQQDIDKVLEKFGAAFPSTKDMSSFARECCGAVEGMSPDQILLAWISKEEAFFRAIERVIVEDKLKSGFADVDEFISFSLSVQNRRKSRMGYSLQNHLAALFDRHNLKYEPQAITEGKSRPDFLFPGSTEYHDPDFNFELLVMLGAKSTLKERWRQILTEAARIKTKHLCTLEARMSNDQTSDIASKAVQLVIPNDFHATYTPEQLKGIWSVEQFIQLVKQTQGH